MSVFNRLPADLRPAPGRYLLILRCHQPQALEIGRLGRLAFDPGWYAYLGSAMGPGGLRQRILRHLRSSDEKRLHWHIDYLRACLPVEEVCWQEGEGIECALANLLAGQAQRWAPGFGASDCRCAGHLLHWPGRSALRRSLAALSAGGFQRWSLR